VRCQYIGTFKVPLFPKQEIFTRTLLGNPGVNKKGKSLRNPGVPSTTMPADHRSIKRKAAGAPAEEQGDVLLQERVQSLAEFCVEVREEGAHRDRRTRQDSRNVSEMLGNAHAQDNRLKNMAAQLNATTVHQRAQEGKLTWTSVAAKESRRDIVYMQQTLVELQAQVHQLQIRTATCNCDQDVQEVVMSYPPVCAEKFRPRDESQWVAAVAGTVEAALKRWMQGNRVESKEEEEHQEAQEEDQQEETQDQEETQ
jgi:hypothetical protein